MSLKLLHIINGLKTGGAEMVLYQLLTRLDQSRFTSEVISLTGSGPIGDRIARLGVPIHLLGLNSRNPFKILELRDMIRKINPDIIQTWMYHSDLIGGVAARLAGSCPVIWGIHNSTLEKGKSKRETRIIARLNAALSGIIPQKIINCSEVSRKIHVEIGFCAGKMTVIPNGFDIDRFTPIFHAHASLCEELGIPPDSILIGTMARFHPQKDHQNFIRAAGLLLKEHPEVHFVLCGDGIDPNNQDLKKWIQETGHDKSRFHLLGPRDDTARIYSALDILTVSSAFGEAFPLVIGEAMSCGTPCVTTDVGDSSLIVGDVGYTVLPRDPAALAEGWKKILSLSPDRKETLKQSVRKRIIDNFELSYIVGKYEQVYLDCISHVRNQRLHR